MNQFFVAHKFSRQKSDDLRRAIAAAFRKTGLEPYYADREVKQKHLLEKIRERVLTSQFGIFDITRQNPNVLIELGIAIGSGKRCYLIVESRTKVATDLEGLDRIEYQSYAELTRQLRRKVVEIEVARLKGVPSEPPKAIDRFQEPSIRKAALKLYQAESEPMFTRCGYPLSDGAAINGSSLFADFSVCTSHIMYGPYEALKAGDYVAFFRLKLNSVSDPHPVLLLDIVGVGPVPVQRMLRGTAFRRPNEYQLFGLPFSVKRRVQLEYRALNQSDFGQVWIDYVAIVEARRLKRMAQGQLQAQRSPGVAPD